MKLLISNASGVPIYAQLKAQIKAAILSGELKAGEALPSLRTVARELRISVLTATRAYSELAQEGFVVNVQGKGCFAMDGRDGQAREHMLRAVEAHLTDAIAAARQAGLEGAELHAMLELLQQEEQ